MTAGALADHNQAAADPVTLFCDGRISAPVAIARLVLTGASPQDLRATLASNPVASKLLALWDSHQPGIARMRTMLAGVNHAGAANLAQIAAQFDQAVTYAADASVASYTLDDPALAAQATAELVDWLVAQRLLRDDADVIDLGCGYGRVAAAMAPPARHVLGLDVSAGMIAAARTRFAQRPELRFEQVDGHGLRSLPASCCDLLFACDSFPYLFQAGVAERHVRDAARLLRADGALVILNLSYAADDSQDRSDVVRWASEAGLQPHQQGVTPFTLWDGRAFVFRAAPAQLSSLGDKAA